MHTIILGDNNDCYHKCGDGSGPQLSVVNTIKGTHASLALVKHMDQVTRVQVFGETVLSSVIDHIYSNINYKIYQVEVIPVGDSDHLGVEAKKITSLPFDHPHTFEVREYSNVGVTKFVKELTRNDTSAWVLECDTLSETMDVFRDWARTVTG